MVYESSYESGLKPLRPDSTRGTWAAPSDFVYSCLASAFKIDVFSVAYIIYVDMGIYSFVSYIICLGLIVVPLLVVQSFMGQFSSSGFISAFRISPLFKGIGYISLALNLAIALYYSVMATTPLIYLLNSLRPTMPWSCEGFAKWSHLINSTDDVTINTCNITRSTTPTNTTNRESSLGTNSSEAEDELSYKMYQIPSTLYFRSLLSDGFTSNFYEDTPFSMSWALVGCNIITWGIIAGVFYKFYSTEKFAKLLRYSIWGTLAVLLICLVRFSFLPGGHKALHKFFVPRAISVVEGIPTSMVFAMTTMSAGWGSVISFASLNKFKTNIVNLSWVIGLAQMIICMLFNLLTSVVEHHFSEQVDKDYNEYVDHHWVLFLSSGSAIANIGWANFWSVIYFGMLTATTLIMLSTHIYSILVSIFDEFEDLRARKMEVTLGLISGLALLSFYFCSNHGFIYFTALTADSLVTQISLNLLLIFVVLWVYGRERFQRDVEFMLGQAFPTWKVNMLRYVTALCLLCVLLLLISISVFAHMFSTGVVELLALVFITLPWFFIPGYAVYILKQSPGTLRKRFAHCLRPTDWYPARMEDRQRYEEAMGNMDITHQLNEVDEEVF